FRVRCFASPRNDGRKNSSPRCRIGSPAFVLGPEPKRKGAFMAKMIFVSLPVSDLERATAFYQAIGAVKNTQFSDGTASCMVFSETIHAMLMTHDKYRLFTSKKIVDAKTSSQVL